MGRTHRDGQQADEVTATALLGCIENFEAMDRAVLDARYIEDSTGQSQKLLYCDLDLPMEGDIMSITSRRFHR